MEALGKERIVDKIFPKNEKTMLVLHFYKVTLKSLKEYVSIFQSSSALYSSFKRSKQPSSEFLSYFMKPEGLSKRSDKELLMTNVEGGNLKVEGIFIGGGATRVG